MTTARITSQRGAPIVSFSAVALLLALCGTAAVAQPEAPSPPTEQILSISVCSQNGVGGAGSCPSGSSDTHQIVLAPDGSGDAINRYGGLGGVSDEHASVFAPGSLQGNGDYLFVVATGTEARGTIGAVVLSGGAGPDANGQWTFDFPKADGYGYYGSDPDNPSPGDFGHIFMAPTAQGHCPTVADGNPAHQDPTFDLNYAAPGSVVKDPTSGPGRLLMVYEGANTCLGSIGGARSDNSAYISTGVATSLDYGYTWPTYHGTASFDFVPLPGANKTQGPNAPSGALGSAVCMGNDCATTPPVTYGRYPILSLPVSLATAMATGESLSDKVGEAEPSAFVDDAGGGPAPYLYVVHGYAPGDLGPSLPNGRKSDLTVARAQLNGGTSRLSFLKWNGQSFANLGVGGVDSPILPDGPFETCGDPAQGRNAGSISYVVPTQQYLLTFICNSPSDPAGGAGSGGPRGSAWFYSISYDLSDPGRWSAPQEIVGSWMPWDTGTPAGSYGCPSFKGWYPTFMSLGRKPGHLSANGHVFYLWGCLGGGAGGTPPKRQYSSRAFTITTGPIHPLRRHLRRAT